jgi:hypothetical protein
VVLQIVYQYERDRDRVVAAWCCCLWLEACVLTVVVLLLVVALWWWHMGLIVCGLPDCVRAKRECLREKERWRSRESREKERESRESRDSRERERFCCCCYYHSDHLIVGGVADCVPERSRDGAMGQWGNGESGEKEKERVDSQETRAESQDRVEIEREMD